MKTEHVQLYTYTAFYSSHLPGCFCCQFGARNESLFECTLPRKGKRWAILVRPTPSTLTHYSEIPFRLHYAWGRSIVAVFASA